MDKVIVGFGVFLLYGIGFGVGVALGKDLYEYWESGAADQKIEKASQKIISGIDSFVDCVTGNKKKGESNA